MLLVLPLLLAAAMVFFVREVSSAERGLASTQTHAARVVTYAIGPGEHIKLRIESGTDVFRVVVHAFRRGTLGREPHPVRVNVDIRTATASRLEVIDAVAPGTALRATAQDDALAVGDPIAMNVDVHGCGTGTLSLTLESVANADGILVRIYRREALGPSDALRRRASLGADRGEHLAQQAGEVDWLDLDASDRTTLVGARWRKVAALRDLDQAIASEAIVLRSRGRARVSDSHELLGTFPVEGDDQLAAIVQGPNALIARATGDPRTKLVASTRSASGATHTFDGLGELTIDVGGGETVEIAISAVAAEALRLEATDASRVALTTGLGYFRTSPERAAIITAGDSPLVLRVTVRSPMSRSMSGAHAIRLIATVAGRSGASTDNLEAMVQRAVADRYDGSDGAVVPSEPAVFHVLVPANGQATLRPAAGRLDLSLSELDPAAPPRRLLESGPGEAVSPEKWPGFLTRRPSNAADFLADDQGQLRIAARLPKPIQSLSSLGVLHVPRSQATQRMHRDGMLFTRARVPFFVDVPGSSRRPLTLPCRLFSEVRASVEVQVDGGHPRRRSAGPAQVVTSSHFVVVSGEAKVTLLLGDDLAPGRHTIAFLGPSDLWVHLPWVQTAKSSPASGWVSGDFDL